MYTYSAYGLDIESEIPLPEFVEAQAPSPDVAIRLAGFSDFPSHAHGHDRLDSTYLSVGEQETVLSIQSVGIFLIRNGCEVVVMPYNGGKVEQLKPILIGTGLALLLLQRGHLVLHASAVNVAGQVVAFMGESGAGKSSLAAALHARGHTIIADDVTAVGLASKPVEILPGFPQTKITVEAARRLGFNTQALIDLGDHEDKRGYRFATSFSRNPLPLSHTYVVSRDKNRSFERISSQDAVVELIRNTYPTRFAHAGGAKHFTKCVKLARKVPMFFVSRPSTLESLPEFAGQLERHIDQFRPGHWEV